jgi:drug/metabolite transporter (DMT)-like permease
LTSTRPAPPANDEATPAASRILATVALLTLIWGTTWSVIRVGLEGIPPFTGVALRFAIAAALLGALARRRGVRLGGRPYERRLWWINGLLSFAGSYTIVYWSEQWVPSGLTAVLFATFPLFVALLAAWWLPGERLGARGMAGTVVGFLGVAVIFSEDFSLLGGRQVAIASAVMLLSPFVSAIANVAVKRWGRGIPALSITTVPMAIGAAVAAVFALAFERDRAVVFDVRSVGALLYLAVVGSAVTFTLYYWLLRQMPATRLSLITYAIPVVAVAIGVLVFDEPMTTRTTIGGALVILGVAFALRRSPPTPSAAPVRPPRST